jgi:hypothetical protein
MNKLWTWFVALAKSRNWSTHAVIASAVTVAGIIAADPAMQQWIRSVFASHPELGSGIVLIALAIAKAWPTRSDAGVLAVARNINALPNPPTEEQVNAADTTINPTK